MRTALERLFRPAVAVIAAMTLLIAMTSTAGATESPPSEPEAGASQTTTQSAKALGDHECDADEWHFVITQIGEGQYPDSVAVSWDSGASGSATFWKYTGSTAHYVTTANLDAMVTGATAELPADWTGQFNLSHGPCPTDESPDEGETDESEETDNETDETDESEQDNEVDEVDEVEESESAKALDDHECVEGEWHFVVTQIDEGDVPATISVTWDNGATEDVTLWKYTGGTAHYQTTSNLDSTVTAATAELPADWTGQFNLSHGPCVEEDETDDSEDDTDDSIDETDDSEDETDDSIDETDDSTDEGVLDDTTDDDTRPDAGEETDVRGDEVIAIPVIDRTPAQPVRPAVEKPAVASTPEVQVLGATTTRSALARTGTGSVAMLAPFGLSLLLLGFGLRRSARRATVR